MNRNAKLLKVVLIVVMASATSTALGQQNVSVASLNEEAANLNALIKMSQEESGKFQGGLIKNTIDLRTEVLKLTKAMVDQKVVAIKTGARSKVELSVNAVSSDEAANVQNEIERTDRDIQRLQIDADRYSGGLIRAQLLSTIATMQGTRAMLLQRMLSVKYGLGIVGKGAGGVQNVSVSLPKTTTAGTKEIPLADSIVKVEILRKNFTEKKYGHAIYFDLKFSGVGLDKPTRAIKGSVVFTDLFGDKILKLKWGIDTPIAVGGEFIERDTGFDFNQFMSEHIRMKDTEMANMKAIYHVDSIIYEDGSRRDF